MARPPIHPGKILADELHELQMSASELARILYVPTNRITELTLSGLKPQRFLKHHCLNILITQVPRLTTFARKCVVIGSNAILLDRTLILS
jgi:hypothetical protein